MFTLIENSKDVRLRNAFIYLGVSLFCIVFGFVYENFAHGVISNNMLFGFLFPTLMGLLPSIIFIFLPKIYPNVISSYLYNAGVATITVRSYFMGALEIYGTDKGDIFFTIYLIAAIILLFSGVLLYLISLINTLIKKH